MNKVWSSLAAALLLAACGGASTAKPQASNATSQSQPPGIDALYAAAKAEGEVVWEAAPIKQGADELAQAFNKKYPGIKVTYSALSDPEVAPRVLTEQAAGDHVVKSLDLAHGGPSLFKPLAERNQLLATDWAKLGLDPKLSRLDGKWLINEDGVTIIIYNTNLVQPADVPQDWSDLLKPRWKGRKIAMNAGPDTLAQLFFTMGEDKATQFLTALKDQQLVITKSKGPAREMVYSGQVHLGPSTAAELVRALPNGTPVAFAPLGPMLHDTRGWYIPNGVQHPNAARLLAAWMVSPEGFAVQSKNGVDKDTPCSASDIAKYICDHNIKYVDENTTGLDPVVFEDKVAEYQAQAGKLIGAAVE